MRNRALNDNLFPASLIHPGHGFVAVLNAQTTFKNLTVFDGKATGSVKERFDLIRNQAHTNTSQVIFIISTAS